MPEGMNIEVAHKLSKREKAGRAKRRWEEITEILEVLILAVAAIATSWSGYQAARGDGRQSVLYGESSRDRFEADAAATLGEQRLAADASMFNAWLQAQAAGTGASCDFVRRFTPITAGLRGLVKTDPFTDPTALRPRLHARVPEPGLEEAKRLNARASAASRRGRQRVRPPTGTCGDGGVRVGAVSWWRCQRFRLPGCGWARVACRRVAVYGLVTAPPGTLLAGSGGVEAARPRGAGE